MLPPIPLNFDYALNQALDPAIVHLPMIYQGSPYDESFAIRNKETQECVDFRGYDEIKMQARLEQNKEVLFELTKSAGQLLGLIDKLQIVFSPDVTESLELPISRNQAITQVPFVYDLELYQAGKVVWQLAAGIGYIVVNTTR